MIRWKVVNTFMQNSSLGNKILFIKVREELNCSEWSNLPILVLPFTSNIFICKFYFHFNLLRTFPEMKMFAKKKNKIDRFSASN